MAKLIYTTDIEFNEEPLAIEFTISDELTIYELKNIVTRMALAMGYAPASVKECFGDYYEGTDEGNIQENLFGTAIEYDPDQPFSYFGKNYNSTLSGSSFTINGDSISNN